MLHTENERSAKQSYNTIKGFLLCCSNVAGAARTASFYFTYHLSTCKKKKSFKCIILKNFRKKRNHLLCACKISQDWALHHFYFWVCTVRIISKLLGNSSKAIVVTLTFKFGSLTCGLIYSQLCTINSEHRSTTCKAKSTTG